IERRAPRVPWAVGQVGAELGQVVTARSEVVVNDVLDHTDPGTVAGVDEALVALGSAVPLVNGVPENTVVAPVVRAVESVDRKHLDEIDPDGGEVVELGCCGVEGSLGGERAD